MRKVVGSEVQKSAGGGAGVGKQSVRGKERILTATLNFIFIFPNFSSP